jgi:dipeptidase
MHFGYGPIKTGQTAGSMVSKLTGDSSIHWVTGTALPCKSLFKPVWIESGLPEMCESENGHYDEKNTWWLQETLNRALVMSPRSLVEVYHKEKEEVEKKIIHSVENSASGDIQQKRELTAYCFNEAKDFVEKWIENLRSVPRKKNSDFLYEARLKNLNKEAKLPLCGWAGRQVE